MTSFDVTKFTVLETMIQTTAAFTSCGLVSCGESRYGLPSRDKVTGTSASAAGVWSWAGVAGWWPPGSPGSSAGSGAVVCSRYSPFSLIAFYYLKVDTNKHIHDKHSSQCTPSRQRFNSNKAMCCGVSSSEVCRRMIVYLVGGGADTALLYYWHLLTGRFMGDHLCIKI